MVQFGSILEESKLSFEESFQSRFVDYEELKRLLVRQGTTALAFEKKLDAEIEKCALFALNCVGRIAGALREFGDVAGAKRATGLLVATVRFVELNLVALRKIVKKRDKFAARTGFAGEDDLLERKRACRETCRTGSNWLLCPARSPHLQCLESFESHFAALLSSARSFRDTTRAAASSYNTSRKTTFNASRSKAEGEGVVVVGSVIGSLIANGDAADARALSELIDSCEHALVCARAARIDLRKHASAMDDLGVDAEADYARTLRAASAATLSPHSSRIASPAPTRRRQKEDFDDGKLPFFDRVRRGWRDPARRGIAAAMVHKCFGGEGQAAYDAGLAAQCSGAVLYAASCYAIAPTVHEYAVYLDSPTPAFAGLLLAAAPLASLASRFFVSEWFVRARVGFKSPVVLGGALCCAGNVLYCVAPTLERHRCSLALFARVAVGASGGADAVNRRYIGTADFPASDRGAAAARYVACDAVGVALGPLLAAACASIIAPSKRDEVTLAVLTTPSLVLAAAWGLHSLIVSVLWHENSDPSAAARAAAAAATASPPSATDSLFSCAEREGLLLQPTTRTLTVSLPPPKPDQRTASDYGGTASSSSSRRRRTTSATRNQSVARRTVSSFRVRSSLARLFASGVVHEVFLASSALVSDREFGWTPRLSGLLLCGLRVVGMASAQSAEDLSERCNERAVSFVATAGALLVLMLIPFFYSKLAFWLIGSFAAFSLAQFMAVAERSLLSKIADSSAKSKSPGVAIAARVCGDLVFAIAMAAAASAPDRTIMFALWFPPSVCLFAALASLFFVVGRAYRTTSPLPSLR